MSRAVSDDAAAGRGKPSPAIVPISLAWVNWTGVDGYYFRATDTFGSVFGSTITDIRAISSAPLLIAETAVGTTVDREGQIGAGCGHFLPAATGILFTPSRWSPLTATLIVRMPLAYSAVTSSGSARGGSSRVRLNVP